MGSKALARITLGIILTLSLAGCRTVKYIPQETVRTDSIYISQVKWDSVYEHDSVLIREKGDTVFVDKTKYKYIERYRHDTLTRERVDSISVPYPVEKELTRMQKWQLRLGKVMMILLTLLGIGGLYWLFMKYIK